MRLTAQQADGGEAEALPSGGQRMQVIGVCATEADHALRARRSGLLQVGRKLEPFVAGHQRIDEIEAQTGELDASGLEPGQLHLMQRRLRTPVGNAYRQDQLTVRRRLLALCRVQQLESPSVKRLGVSIRSMGMAQRSPLGKIASQLGC